MKKFFLLSLFFLFLVIFYWGLVFFLPCGQSAFPKEVVISPHQSAARIAKNLKKEGVVCDDFVFRVYLFLSGQENKIKAGRYLLDKPLDLRGLAKLLVKGSAAPEREIKIIEGWNIKDIADYLDKEKIVNKSDFLVFVKQGYRQSVLLEKYDFLKEIPEGQSLEGFLFPDTYRIYKKTTSEEIVDKMLQNFSRQLTPTLKEEIKKQGRDIYEIVTMASIIEKEVQSLEDKRKVSGIFWKRIKNNYPLESCATLAYILGENKKQYSYEDTRTPSPYNTYLNKGLPPGPICSPGFDSIKAAVHPEFTDYNFFLSTPQGKTVFSKTFSEHLRNKNTYLK